MLPNLLQSCRTPRHGASWVRYKDSASKQTSLTARLHCLVSRLHSLP